MALPSAETKANIQKPVEAPKAQQPKKGEFYTPLEPKNSPPAEQNLARVANGVGLHIANKFENTKGGKREKMSENTPQAELAFFAKLTRYATGAIEIDPNTPLSLLEGNPVLLAKNPDGTYGIANSTSKEIVQVNSINSRNGNKFICNIAGTVVEVDSNLVVTSQLIVAYEKAGGRAEFGSDPAKPTAEQKIIDAYIKSVRGEAEPLKDVKPEEIKEAAKKAHVFQTESLRKFVDHLIPKPAEVAPYIKELSEWDSESLRIELATITEITIPDQATRDAKKAELQTKIDTIEKKHADPLERASKKAELETKIFEIEAKNTFRDELLKSMEGKTYATYGEAAKILSKISEEGLKSEIAKVNQNIETYKQLADQSFSGSLGKALAGHEGDYAKYIELQKQAEEQQVLLLELQTAVTGDNNTITDFFVEAEQGKKDEKTLTNLEQAFIDGKTDKLLDDITGILSDADKKKIKTFKEKFKENAPMLGIGGLLFAFIMMKKASESSGSGGGGGGGGMG